MIPQESVEPVIVSYWCQTCDGYTTAIVVDEGRIPGRVACRAKGLDRCDGAAFLDDRRHDDVEPRWELHDPLLTRRRPLPSDENGPVATATSIRFLLLRKRVAS